MAGKRLTPEQTAQAIAMREASYTLPTIVERVGGSTRTLRRLFAAHDVKPGAVREELIEEARKKMLTAVSDVDGLRAEVARQMFDDLAMARLVRAKTLEVLEGLTTDDHDQAREASRALAAVATALKLTQDITRRAIGTDRLQEAGTMEDLPELTIQEMTAEDVRAVRDAAAREPDSGDVMSDDELAA